MMATEIIEIDAAWAEKWTKTRVPFSSAPTVVGFLSVKVLERVPAHSPQILCSAKFR